MNCRVLYYSKGGNTKKVADKIAEAISAKIETLPPAYPLDNVKILFLGAGVYGGKLDPKVVDYINTLEKDKVKNVALFGTSGSPDAPEITLMRELCEKRGMNVLKSTYHCKGKFFLFFNRNHPNTEELAKAQKFANDCVNEVKDD